MDRKSIQAVIVFLLILTSGCIKGTDKDPQPLPVSDTSRRVLVVCEGSLGNGNSALTLYLPDKDSVYEDIYSAANGQSIGDVFQSITRFDNRYFLCVNNSGLIKVIDRNTWKLTGPTGSQGLIGVNTPRYILPVSSEKAYVSSLFTNNITKINPAANAQISFGIVIMPYKNPEGMALLNGKAYVALWDTACSKLFAVTPSLGADQITDSIALPGRAPQEVLVDKEQKLWVMAGNVYDGKTATLTRIDPVTNQQLQVYVFNSGADPLRPVFNETKDTLYFIEVKYDGSTANNGVYRMGIHDAALPAQPFIPTQGFQYYWALGIQPGTGHIYVGDPKGFTQRGAVSVYNQQGQLLKTFATGVGPGHFLFD